MQHILPKTLQARNMCNSLPGCTALVSGDVGGHRAPIGAHLCVCTNGPVNRASNGSRNRRGIALSTGEGGLAVDLYRAGGGWPGTATNVGTRSRAAHSTNALVKILLPRRSSTVQAQRFGCNMKRETCARSMINSARLA